MSDVSGELSDLRKEIVESRNQAIKTDHQVKNLALDVKGFDQRFEALERRTRIAGLGVNVVIALTVALGSYFAYSVQLGRYERNAKTLQNEAEEIRQAAEARMASADKKLAAIEAKKSEKARANKSLIAVLDAVDKRKENDAVKKLMLLDRNSLDPVVRRLADKQLSDLRDRASESAYKSSQSNYNAGRYEAAIPDLERYKALLPQGRYAPNVRYRLMLAYWKTRRDDKMVAVAEEIRKKDNDPKVIAEARYFKAAAMAHLGQAKEAKSLFVKIVQSNQPHSKSSSAYLAALESGSELPDSQRR